MASDYGRIHRLLKILTLIQGEAGWTSRRLAAECGTTERTIYRDMKILEGAGVPYFYDPQTKGYGVRRDFFMPPVQLTLDESLALAALARDVGGREQIPFMGPAGRAITKIRGLLPAAIRNELERIEDQVMIQLAAANPPEGAADVHDLVRTAMSRRLCLTCEYESLSKSPRGTNGSPLPGGAAGEPFRFSPYALFFGQRAWYVIGHHGTRDAVRCLKLNRFTRVELTEVPYLIPKTFSLDRHMGNAWRMIRGSKSYAIELRFDPEFAETIADTHWHQTQEILWDEDGSITFRCTVDGLDEIVWWVLSMGPHCVVQKPRELAARVQELAAAVLRQYGQ